VLVTSWGGTTYAWGSALIIGLSLATVAFTAGWLISARRSADPVIPLRLFSDDAFWIACAISLVLGVAMFGAISYLPTYLQIVTGVSPTVSGLLMLPLIAGLLATIVSSGRRIATTGRYRSYPIAGAALAAVGVFLLSRLGLHTSHLTSSLYMIVLGLGIGLIMQVMVLVAQNSASYADLGAATSAVNLARQVGSSVGVALIGALFIHRLHVRLARDLPPGAASHAGTAITSLTPQALSRLPEAFQLAIKTAFAEALPPIYVYLVPLVAAAFVLALILPERTLRTRAFTPLEGVREG
jgi:predicted MFS family arabinose efflux permease